MLSNFEKTIVLPPLVDMVGGGDLPVHTCARCSVQNQLWQTSYGCVGSKDNRLTLSYSHSQPTCFMFKGGVGVREKQRK